MSCEQMKSLVNSKGVKELREKAYSISSKDIKCDKILPDGKVCGKSLGNCIHSWIIAEYNNA